MGRNVICTVYVALDVATILYFQDLSVFVALNGLYLKYKGEAALEI